MMKKIIYIILLSFVIPSQSNVGITAASFLGIGVGTRAMSMGGAFTAMINDPSVLYWNPGAIALIDNNKFQISNTKWLLDTQWIYSAYVHKLDDNSAIAANIFYLDYGKEEITTLEEQHGTGRYWSAYDLSAGFYYGRNLTDRFSFGAGAKYIRQTIYNETASTIALDIGLLYKNYNNNLRLGASISNIGFEMKLEGSDLYYNCDLDPENSGNNDNVPCELLTDNYPLPIYYRVGIAKDFNIGSNLITTTSLDWVIPNDDVEHFNLGLELNYKNKFFVRCGYRQLGKSDTEENLTFGLGGNVFIIGREIELNYAYHDFGIWGYMQYFEFIFNL